MLLVLEVSPGIYLATLRDAAGELVCRLTGPPAWVLEQLGHAMGGNEKKAPTLSDRRLTMPQ